LSKFWNCGEGVKSTEGDMFGEGETEVGEAGFR
jgi:hypothetical protein